MNLPGGVGGWGGEFEQHKHNLLGIQMKKQSIEKIRFLLPQFHDHGDTEALVSEIWQQSSFSITA